ncbi:MAG: HAD-IA family hydrolase [Gammaproteobacteria bacterium]
MTQMQRPFRLLIFDWDGTLMDSEARIVACIRAATEEMGLRTLSNDHMKNVIGLGLAEAIQMLFPGSDDDFGREFVARYRKHFFRAEENPTPLFEGAYATLQSLYEQGYWMAVATGKGRRGLDQALERTGCGDFFLTTRCADEAPSKPHPEMLLAILEELGVDADDTLMIGDTEYDMQMARSAGTHALAVSYGVHELERLLNHQPLGFVDDIRELPAWLGNRQAAHSSLTET